jgi:CheY-like chemotaxis protein
MAMVLVVDDNQDAAELIAEVLAELGHTAEVALDGEVALGRALALRPDVALIDLGLPGIDGLEVARRLRAVPALAAIRLIAVTGFSGDRDRDLTRDAGFDAHLVKPVHLEDLVREIAAAGAR